MDAILVSMWLASQEPVEAVGRLSLDRTVNAVFFLVEYKQAIAEVLQSQGRPSADIESTNLGNHYSIPWELSYEMY